LPGLDCQIQAAGFSNPAGAEGGTWIAESNPPDLAILREQKGNAWLAESNPPDLAIRREQMGERLSC